MRFLRASWGGGGRGGGGPGVSWIESTALGTAPALKSPRPPPENRPKDKGLAEPGTWARLLLGLRGHSCDGGKRAKSEHDAVKPRAQV